MSFASVVISRSVLWATLLAASAADGFQRIQEQLGLQPGSHAVQTTAAKELRKELEALQGRRVALAARTGHGGPAAVNTVSSLNDVQRHLDARSAIVGWLEVNPAPGEVDVWACVLRQQGPPAWVRLPPAAVPTTTHIKHLALFHPPHRRDANAAVLAAFRQRYLAPIAAHLSGVQHIIVLAGAAGGVPLDILTTDFTVSHAASATMVSWLMAQRNRLTDQRHTLLAIGDPDFSGFEEKWRPLVGTRLEVQTIAALAGVRVDSEHVLLGSAANEGRLQEMPLARYRFIHLASHGVMDNYAPWNSALLLTRATSDVLRASAMHGEPIFDGRLTADQIMRTWTLDADLVTLSGCETGLGRLEPGEGYLGFSQALLVSGARGLVLSRWKVDDRATALLMRRFYENLLGRFDTGRRIPGRQFAARTPMPAASALHEARHWLRSSTPQANRAALVAMGFEEQAGTPVGRGIGVAAEKPRRPFDYSDPHYWGAFILIGASR